MFVDLPAHDDGRLTCWSKLSFQEEEAGAKTEAPTTCVISHRLRKDPGIRCREELYPESSRAYQPPDLFLENGPYDNKTGTTGFNIASTIP